MGFIFAATRYVPRMGTRGRRRALFVAAVAAIGALIAAVSASAVVGPTSLVSAPSGVADPNPTDIQYVGASKDGSHVFFQTKQKLTAEDKDSNRLDVYERFRGKTVLISDSTGVVDPNTDNVKFVGISDDGTKIFLETNQRMTADDNDGTQTDVYRRSGGATKLMSGATDVADPGSGTAAYKGSSRDGERVWFDTDQRLSTKDADLGQYDVYERFGDTTALVSTITLTLMVTPDPKNGGSFFAGASYDGERVFFETFQKLTSDDTDSGRIDVYVRYHETTQLVSKQEEPGIDPNSGDSHYAGSSADGFRTFFTTTQKLVATDNDAHLTDIYERFNQKTVLASGETDVDDPNNDGVDFRFVSEDGNRIYFESKQRLTPDDTDTGQLDVYEHSEGKTKLVSKPLITGQGDHDATFGGASQDGTHAFFTTRQRMTTTDKDPAGKALNDVYERAGGTTTLASRSFGGVKEPAARSFDSVYAGSSASGNRVFFTTNQKLTPEDFDTNRSDIYERAGGVTALVSKPSDTNDPDTLGPSTFVGTSNLGSIMFFTTRDKLRSKDKDSGLNDIYAAGSPDPGQRPKNVAPRVSKLRVKGSRISFRVSERATVKFGVYRKVGKRYKKVKAGFSAKVTAGTKSVKFKTRKRLRRGTYRLRAVAVDSGRKKSKTAAVNFRIR